MAVKKLTDVELFYLANNRGMDPKALSKKLGITLKRVEKLLQELPSEFVVEKKDGPIKLGNFATHKFGDEHSVAMTAGQSQFDDNAAQSIAAKGTLENNKKNIHFIRKPE